MEPGVGIFGKGNEKRIALLRYFDGAVHGVGRLVGCAEWSFYSTQNSNVSAVSVVSDMGQAHIQRVTPANR